MKKNRTLILVVAVIAVLFLAWYFSNIVAYILISAILSFIGHPLVKLFDRLRLGKLHFPHALSTIVTLVLLFAVIFSVIGILVPVIASQANLISGIDLNALYDKLREPLGSLEEMMTRLGIIQPDDTLEGTVLRELRSFLNIATFKSLFSGIFTLTGDFFITVFSVLFITFFFLKDEDLFFNGIMLVVPEQHESAIQKVLKESQHLLTRYFIGLCLELTIIFLLVTLGLTIFGVKNALIIGLIAGILTIIPYIGPILGTLLGVVVGMTTSLGLGDYSDLFPVILKIILVCSAAHVIDNMFFQPLIYSKSVKAHPLEIFIVIMVAGSLAGIPGMIVAIPVYTVIRVIGREFFSQYKLVKKLTQKI